MTSASDVQSLRVSVRGQVLCPGEPDYDTVRRVHNASIDRRAAIIARCVGAADVIACVRFAREHDLLVSVRGGRHSIAGKAVCDDGLMIDLSGMKGIRVDPTKRTVRAEPGLTLGGGFGWLMRKHGLACDNLIAADVVTADGRLLTASATENEDLFWGLRVLRPLRAFDSPLVDLFGSMSYVALQSMFDPFFPPGRYAYTKANFLTELTDEAISTFAEYATPPSPYTGGFVEQFEGAVARVGTADTAFAHRQYPYNFSIWANWTEPAESPRNIAWTREFWDAMRPFMASGAYINYLE